MINTKKQNKAFTLVELIIVVAIIAIIFAVGVPSYQQYVEEGRKTIAIADITTISGSIDQYFAANYRYPDSLAEVFMDSLEDPWGNPYSYTNISNVRGNGGLRKDRNLVPINSDYDLYSSGPDGKSVGPLTAKASRDDIIRASNGNFIGNAEDF